MVWQAASAAVGQRFFAGVAAGRFECAVSIDGHPRRFTSRCLSSFGRILEGFAMAMALGLALAAAAHRCWPLRTLIAPPMAAIKATPVASFVILALIWVPSRSLSVLTGFLMVLPIAYTNALAGLQSADPNLLEMARAFRFGPVARARAVYLPAAWPHLIAACELSLGLCWKAGIAAEVIGLPDHSIGEALYRAKIFLNTPDLFAWTIAIVLLSVTFEKGMLALLRRTRGRGMADGPARNGVDPSI